ncbi:MAG TPA: hypothetical protein VM911_14265 [Pyrinomonadaceae bacterium]|nr:hypothetical protein [Pyrinomonadaceae bacterium]
MIKPAQLIRQKLRDPSARRAAIYTLILLIIWCFFYWRALHTFGPSTAISIYNSDAAIPVMMCNEERPVTVFSLYYYAADRWGGWPFLFAKSIRYLTGYRWTDQGLYAMQAFWIFFGALVLAALSRRDRLPVTLIYITVLCLHSRVHQLLFLLSQVYAWQLTAFLLGWYCLRRFLESYQENQTFKTPFQKQISKHIVWGFLVLWFSYFAVWSSPASAPFLIFLCGVESWRMYLKTEGARANKKFRRGITLGAALILSASLIERLQKMNYHRYGLKRYGNDFKTNFELDTGYLTENLKIHLNTLGKLSWWPLDLLPAVALLAIGIIYLYFHVSKRKSSLQRLREILSLDTTMLIVGCYGIACLNFVLVVLVHHVRLSLYDDRFLTLTHLLVPVSAMILLFMIFDLTAKFFKVRQYARSLLIVAGVIFLKVNFPAEVSSPQYQAIKETAFVLNQKAPRGVLMGGYWETYVFITFQERDALTPVPFEGQGYRTPWTPERLKQVDTVVVEYRRSKLGGTEGPPAQLQQHGYSLRLLEPKWYENGEHAFALYLNETRRSLQP